MTHAKDEVPGRGLWLHTSMGGRFFPANPHANEVRMSDIANGLALDCRYAGQGRVDRFYSVAEHSALMAVYALKHSEPEAAYVALLHDASEAYLNDLAHSVKLAVGEPYVALEEKVQRAVWQHFGLQKAAERWRDYVKDLDRRIVPLEKRAIMRHPQPWAADALEPLEGVRVSCLEPFAAKHYFLNIYGFICNALNLEPEETEI